MEKEAEISFESCTAYFDEDEEDATVMGEIISTSDNTSKTELEIEILVYDKDGDLLDCESECIDDFCKRGSFKSNFLDLPGKPALVKVFPNKKSPDYD
jgi:hypothetical protein